MVVSSHCWDWDEEVIRLVQASVSRAFVQESIPGRGHHGHVQITARAVLWSRRSPTARVPCVQPSQTGAAVSRSRSCRRYLVSHRLSVFFVHPRLTTNTTPIVGPNHRESWPDGSAVHICPKQRQRMRPTGAPSPASGERYRVAPCALDLRRSHPRRGKRIGLHGSPTRRS